MAMNCDRIARWYRLLEYGSFGPVLWRCRCTFLDRALHARRVLMVGEGDGRFLRRFLRANDVATVDYVDSSAVMGELARRRIAETDFCHRVTFFTSDLRDLALAPHAYDLIFTHFFLDCFDTSEAYAMIQKLARSATNGALWVVSEFAVTGRGWRAWRSRLWVNFLYAAFRLTTGLRIRKLPSYNAGLEDCGFHLVHRRTRSAGLLKSELWQRSMS